jgi:ABC-type nitrate/sulfonate/bicarbonate transport system permease component
MKASTLRVISLLTLAAIWEIAGRTGNAHLLPPLSKVITVWVELLVSGQLFQAIAISFQALTIGFFISVVFGVPLGLLMGRYRRLESFLDIYMTALLAVQKISLIPLLVNSIGVCLHSRFWYFILFSKQINQNNTTTV